MAEVSGYLSDLALEALSGRFPRLLFRLDRPSTAGANLVVTAPVEATIHDATGAFTVNVVSSYDLIPEVGYTITADWDAGRELDVLTGLRVPPEGGNISDLIAATTAIRGELMIITGFGPPPPMLENVGYIDISGEEPELYTPESGGI